MTIYLIQKENLKDGVIIEIIDGYFWDKEIATIHSDILNDTKTEEDDSIEYTVIKLNKSERGS